MIKHHFENLNIEVYDVPAFYTVPDNPYPYSLYYYSNECQDSQGSMHGVRIYNSGVEVNSCLLIGTVGTTVHQTSVLFDDDLMLICCGDALFCLGLPDLDLKWQTQVDFVACFQIFKLEQDYLVHGEIEVSRIDKDGEIKWNFSGADIFVVLDNTEAIALQSDHIFLTDFEKNTYKIDFNGSVMWDSIRND